MSAHRLVGWPAYPCDSCETYFLAMIETTLLPGVAVQNSPHAVINWRRFSSASPRRYALSVESPETCARAASQISRENEVWSPAQSRNALRKPWTVASLIPVRRRTSIIADDESDLPLWPGKIYELTRIALNLSIIDMVWSESGTRCIRADFMRSAGTVQTFSPILISCFWRFGNRCSRWPGLGSLGHAG
jgi:hypothetical protein